MNSDPIQNDEQILPDPTLIASDDRLQPDEIEMISEANNALLRLSDTRAIEINASGPFLRSKLAWKVAVYAHGLQHRIVSLGDAVAICWNNRNILGAMLASRALVETIAVIVHLERTIERLLRAEDLGTLNEFVDNGTFATRDREVISRFPEVKARNILTSIAFLEKSVPGILAHYDRLSERCHPNYMGHVALFSVLSPEERSVSFRNDRDPDANKRSVVAAYCLLFMAEEALASVSDLNNRVSDLQHRKHPIVKEQL